jgi:L-threonylcarbamoyladenylate synthase
MAWIRRYDMSLPGERPVGIEQATDAVRRGELVVLPTDTVYGLGTDAFSPEAVGDLLKAKGRGRDMPVPVLVGSPRTLDGIATRLGTAARALVEAFWPGGLTLVAHAQPSLQWDLGDTRGTVAVRMPDHEVALELLARTGPLAVSSANRTGMPAAEDADAAEEMLGDAVEVVLDAGRTPGPVPSTIVDVTGETGRVLRRGGVSLDRLNEVLADLGTRIVDEG